MDEETPSVELFAVRLPGETWRECAGRLGDFLREEVLADFDVFVAEGRSEPDAAFCALCEWDVGLGVRVDGKVVLPPGTPPSPPASVGDGPTTTFGPGDPY